jgi:hypothetical protein
MPISYTNPGWSNLNPPAINAANLNGISNAIATIGSAYDQGGDPAYIYGGSVPFYSNIITGNGNATLPSSAAQGQRISYINKGNYTYTVNASGGQTIGTTASTSFILYYAGDRVTLEYDGTSVWYVFDTNGPMTMSYQTSSTTTSVNSSWTAIGGNLTLGTLPAGIYDIELDLTSKLYASGAAVSDLGISIGSGTTPISNVSHSYLSSNGVLGASSPNHCKISSYAIGSSATIQAIYYSSATAWTIVYDATTSIGRISARRIG